MTATISIDMTAPGNAARFHLIQIKHAIRIYDATGMIATRGATPKRLLALLSQYTGKSYKNTAQGRLVALADIAAMLESV